ncbi:MAG TPA: thioredoxin domain-containing protein [Puia sp.]|nr:thioredoxin domain-containing protein [Puia sp.]
MPNRLGKETSPYLLQHAHNPVDWYPWGTEALNRAKAEGKPILVSIGYAACHWCHVMERESFEDADTARFMNEHFVNIKIDREERPDLDHIYMDAVQAISGSGGWPLNVFLTSDARPFYGGTYFPPRPLYNRPSWKEVLAGVARSWEERRAEIEEQAGSLTRHVAGAGSFGIGQGSADSKPADPPFTPAILRQIRDQLLATADKKDGGFGHAPKFPQTFSIRYLLHYYYYHKDREALDHACLSLDKMTGGGIFDQLGGGFARYSTDGEWLVPHFEKMLYDNALLVIALCEAWQLTRKPAYRDAIERTMSFVHRELSNGQGAFYSALDADSEGIEGKYYVWDKTEIEMVAGEDAELFCAHFGVTEEGNWEGKNILVRKPGFPTDPAVAARLEKARDKLLEYRARRVRPALDDKVLLGWNALMNVACARAFGALGKEEYRSLAIANMDFLQSRLKGEGIHYYYHSFKEGARIPAFLDDYAFLIWALIELQEISGESRWLVEARAVLEEVIAHFSEEGTGLFYYTHDRQPDLILRKKEVYDGATPAGNSVMAFNLLYLSLLFDQPEWAERSRRMAEAVRRLVSGYPGSFGIWATLYQALTYTIPEIVITARRPENARKEFLSQLIPYRVFQSSSQEDTHFPLLRDKPAREVPQFFLCENYACQLPVNQLSALIRRLENVNKIPLNSYNNPV